MIKARKMSSQSVEKDVIKQLKTLNQQLNKDFGVSKIGVFGSYARGKEKKNSDIDVLVEFEPGHCVGLITLAGMENELSDLVADPILHRCHRRV